MIPLLLGDVVPTVRLRKAQTALAATTDHDSGRQLVATRSAAAYTSMRERLTAAQHRKCAYCEDYLRDRMVEVDHVRPKAPTSQVGYWWLAYSVSNLVATCRSCNNAKAQKWMVRPGSRRLRPRETPDGVTERAMLVDPTTDDPDKHLTWVYAGRLWRIAALTDRGRWTINALALDRDSFLFESNEYIVDVVDPPVEALRAAISDRDRLQFEAALTRLDELHAVGRRWSQLVRVLRAHALAGSYQRPARAC